VSTPERDIGLEPSATPDPYITEISVPPIGDGGVQRLSSHMREPEPAPDFELEAGDDGPAERAADFYGWHADWGHAPQWDVEGPYCGTCSELGPRLAPELEAEAEFEAGI
jgi:hypothetical protein